MLNIWKGNTNFFRIQQIQVWQIIALVAHRVNLEFGQRLTRLSKKLYFRHYVVSFFLYFIRSYSSQLYGSNCCGDAVIHLVILDVMGMNDVSNSVPLFKLLSNQAHSNLMTHARQPDSKNTSKMNEL